LPGPRRSNSGAFVILTKLFVSLGRETLAELVLGVIPVAIAWVLALGRYNR